jgi:3-oxoacyl-[acyl-carrier-protein] synthase II
LNPVAVTGYACRTCLGDDIDATWPRLLAGETGLRTRDYRLTGQTPAVAALVGPVEGAAGPPEARMVSWAADAIARAAADADIVIRPDDQLVLGISLGAFGCSGQSISSWARATAAAVGVTRPPVVVSTACSTGTDVLLLACDLIGRGAANRVIAAAVDVLTPTKVLGLYAAGVVTETAPRPFQHGRDGTAPGEAAAAMVLEQLKAEPNRRVRAEVLGGANGNDAVSMTAGDETGAALAHVVRRGMRATGTDPRDVAVLSAHATSTVLNDMSEARAYQQVFQAEPQPVIMATKAALGHSLGATGLVEAITVIQTLRTGDVPPVPVERPTASELTLPLATQGTRLNGTTGLSVTVGMGGALSAVLFHVPRNRQPTAASEDQAAVLGQCHQEVPSLDGVRPLLPRMYSDPSAWLLASTAQRVLHKQAPQTTDPEDIGVIVISAEGPATTWDTVLAQAADGFVSPARFAAASPSSLMATICMTTGARGQAMTLVMDPEAPATTGTVAALRDAWLTGPAPRSRLVLTCAHSRTPNGHLFTCTLHGPAPA